MTWTLRAVSHALKKKWHVDGWTAEYLIPRATRPSKTKSVLLCKIQSLLSDAQKHTNERNAKHRDDTAYAQQNDVEYDAIGIIKLLRMQRSRCYYTNIPLSLDGPWKMSLERLDQSKGYVIGNVGIIAHRFNTSPFQWSRAFAACTWPCPANQSSSNEYHERFRDP